MFHSSSFKQLSILAKIQLYFIFFCAFICHVGTLVYCAMFFYSGAFSLSVMVLMIFNFISLLALLTIYFSYLYCLHLIVLDILCLIFVCIIYFFDTCKFFNQIVACSSIAFYADSGVGFFSFVFTNLDKQKIIDISEVCTDIQVDSDNPIECTVCLENIVEGACELNNCKHVFHKQCVQLWLQKFQTTCPNCRAEV